MELHGTRLKPCLVLLGPRGLERPPRISLRKDWAAGKGAGKLNCIIGEGNHLRALESKGMLERQPGKARALILKSFVSRASVIDIPLYGAIPAGLPADQQQESGACVSIDVETLRLPRNSRAFALKVRGDSMINAGIHNGDTVIMEFKEPKNKDVVAALIDGETTLKRYIVQRGKPFLRAENPSYPDLIPARELVIQGVMIALLRLVK